MMRWVRDGGRVEEIGGESSRRWKGDYARRTERIKDNNFRKFAPNRRV
jgi:hypothetical protein